MYPYQREQLHVIHFNHGLRGEESDADEDFVRSISKEQNLQFHSQKASNLENANEAELRNARNGFIHAKMAEHQSRVLLQGHQQDDVAETILMRLSRGASLSGLAAPRSVQELSQIDVLHFRPLLSVTRDSIHSSLRSLGLTWREDTSNQSDGYFRNRVRNQLVPVWKEIVPQNLLTAVAQSRKLLEEDDSALQLWAEKVFASSTSPTPEILQWPEEIPGAVLRRVLFLWIQENQLNSALLSPPIVNQLVEAVENKAFAKVSLSSGLQIVTDPDQHHLQLLKLNRSSQSPDWPVSTLPPNTYLYLPTGHFLSWEFTEISLQVYVELISGKNDDCREIWLKPPAWANEPKRLLVRQRRPGDQYQPLGMKTAVRLQNHLVNKKIPADERDLLPVITTEGDQVLWCPGLPAPEELKITDPNTPAIRIQYLIP